MGVVLGGCGDVGYRSLSNKGVRLEAIGKKMEYVAGRPICKLCTGVERMEVSSRLLGWWYQEHGPTQADRKVGLKINIG